MGFGRCARTTHVKAQQGPGQVTHDTRKRHTGADLTFCKRIARGFAKGEVHLTLDNVSTHETPAVEVLARAAPALSPPVHPHQRLLDESHRGLVRHPHSPGSSPRIVRRRARPRRDDRRVRQREERPSYALRVDQDGGSLQRDAHCVPRGHRPDEAAGTGLRSAGRDAHRGRPARTVRPDEVDDLPRSDAGRDVELIEVVRNSSCWVRSFHQMMKSDEPPPSMTGVLSAKGPRSCSKARAMPQSAR